MMAATEVGQPEEERIGKYRVHPAASMFPLLEGQDYEDLRNSIEAYGLLKAIVLLDGVLLDGRNRLKACLELEIEPRVVQYTGKLDPVDYILVSNVDRRHLTEDARSAICTKISAWRIEQRNAARQKEAGKEGGRGHKKNPNTKTYEGFPEPKVAESKTRDQNARTTVGQIAETAKVSHHKAAQAVAVNKAAPDLLEQVAKGEMKLKDAYAKVRAAAPEKPPREPAKPPKYDVEKAAASCGLKISAWIAKCPSAKRAEFKAMLLEECKHLCGK
jgi:hypothetical protein